MGRAPAPQHLSHTIRALGKNLKCVPLGHFHDFTDLLDIPIRYTVLERLSCSVGPMTLFRLPIQMGWLEVQGPL